MGVVVLLPTLILAGVRVFGVSVFCHEGDRACEVLRPPLVLSGGGCAGGAWLSYAIGYLVLLVLSSVSRVPLLDHGKTRPHIHTPWLIQRVLLATTGRHVR